LINCLSSPDVIELVLGEVVELGQRARDAAAFGCVGGRHRAFDRVVTTAFDLVVVAVAGDAEVAVRSFQALHAVFAEVEAALEEEIVGLGIGHRAAGVHADAAAIAVVGDAALDVRSRDDQVVVLLLQRVVHPELPALAVVAELR
jgi:hypothetical protein